jgi:phosphatidate cytidylyltransferase
MGEFLRVTLPVFAAGALAFWYAGRRVPASVRRARWIKFATYLVIVHAVLAAALAGRAAIVILMAGIAVGGLAETVGACRRIPRGTSLVVPILFCAVAVGAVAFGASAPPLLVAYVYSIVAAFDGFSQAGGQLAGRRRLAPTVSPGKTVEGFLIGIVGAIVCALLLRGAVTVPVTPALLLAVIVSVTGVAGDLAASWVKRRASLKDFGTILPSHGGVLDRFDSFLAAAAAMFVVIRSGWWLA